MRRIILSLAAAMFLLGFVAVGSAVSAASSISDTGPGSTNTIDQNNSNSFSQSIDNFINVNNNSHQTCASGSATVSGNTTGGNATSGNAACSNVTTTTIGVGGKGGAGVTGGVGGGGAKNPTIALALPATLPATGGHLPLAAATAAALGVAAVGIAMEQRKNKSTQSK